MASQINDKFKLLIEKALKVKVDEKLQEGYDIISDVETKIMNLTEILMQDINDLNKSLKKTIYEKTMYYNTQHAKLIKGKSLDIYIDGDDEILEIKHSIKEKENILKYLEDVNKKLETKHWDLKNIVTWEMYLGGKN